MIDKNGRVCEYDGHKVPKVMSESKEREELHEKSIEEGRKILEEAKKKYGF